MYHCGGGPGADTFDPLTALEQWVEKGAAPETMVAKNRAGGIERPCVPGRNFRITAAAIRPKPAVSSVDDQGRVYEEPITHGGGNAARTRAGSHRIRPGTARAGRTAGSADHHDACGRCAGGLGHTEGVARERGRRDAGRQFGYKPTPAQRSYGEQIMHVVQTNQFVAGVLGGKTPAPAINLKAATKAEVMTALRQSMDLLGTRPC